MLVDITDYGVLSKKIVPVEATAPRQRNSVCRGDDVRVARLREIVPHHRDAAGQRQIFKVCCAKNLVTFSDGKLFRCPYAANAARLAAVPDDPNDYIDLFQEPLDERHRVARFATISTTKTI